MKTLSSKMKILLVLAICAAMMLPSVVSAALENHVDEEFSPGGKKSTIINFVSENPVGLQFTVINIGEKVVSSIKLTLSNKQSKERVVVLSPEQFNQNKDFSSKQILIGTDELDSLIGEKGDVVLDINVGGPKNSRIHLTVNEIHFPVPTGGAGSWIQ